MLAACGSTAIWTPAPTQRASSGYPCNLLTIVEIRRAIGVHTAPGMPTVAVGQGGEPSDPRCAFTVGTPQRVANGLTVPVGDIEITMITASQFASCHIPPQNQGASSSPIPVEGTDEALLDYGPGGFGTTVCARRGTREFIVHVPGGYPNHPLEQAVAQLVAANLHVASSPTARPAATPSPVPGALTDEDDGRTVDVPMGTVVVIHLDRGTDDGYEPPTSSDDSVLVTLEALTTPLGTPTAGSERSRRARRQCGL